MNNWGAKSIVSILSVCVKYGRLYSYIDNFLFGTVHSLNMNVSAISL